MPVGWFLQKRQPVETGNIVQQDSHWSHVFCLYSHVFPLKSALLSAFSSEWAHPSPLAAPLKEKNISLEQQEVLKHDLFIAREYLWSVPWRAVFIVSVHYGDEFNLEEGSSNKAKR